MMYIQLRLWSRKGYGTVLLKTIIMLSTVSLLIISYLFGYGSGHFEKIEEPTQIIVSGSLVILFNGEYKVKLHSSTRKFLRMGMPNLPFGDTSGLNMVTATSGKTVVNNVWRVELPEGDQPGREIKCSDLIMLKHTVTRRNLQSLPNYATPISFEQEVETSMLAEDIMNQWWRVECPLKNIKRWQYKKLIIIRHFPTSSYLFATGEMYPGTDDMEVATVYRRAFDVYWTAYQPPDDIISFLGEKDDKGLVGVANMTSPVPKTPKEARNPAVFNGTSIDSNSSEAMGGREEL